MTPLSAGSAAAVGALYGAGFGAVGGALAGAVALLVADWLGWTTAAVLGGLAPGVMVAGLAWWTARPSHAWMVPEIAFLSIPALIAAALGIAVGRGLRAGRSSVPGVQSLVAVVNEARPQPQAGERSGVPAEVTPARAPAGRGDEAAPAV